MEQARGDESKQGPENGAAFLLLAGWPNLDAPEGGLWLPNAHFDSWCRRRQVVDDHPQLVFACCQLIWNFKLENSTYRLGRP